MSEDTNIESAPDPLILAYLAGMIDGDGYITIHRSQRKGVLYHAAQIGIAGTSPEPHELAASIWGGKVHCYRPKNRAHRPQYQWVRTGRGAGKIIEQLLPYLRVKAENATLALELQSHVEDGDGDDPFPWFGPDYDPIAVREEMRNEMIDVLATRKRPEGVEHSGMPANA